MGLHLPDLGGSAIDTSSAIGKFFLTVMAGAAELERNQISERTSAVLQHKAERGEYTGGEPPFGYRLADEGVRLVEDVAEQASWRARASSGGRERPCAGSPRSSPLRGSQAAPAGRFAVVLIQRLLAAWARPSGALALLALLARRRALFRP